MIKYTIIIAHYNIPDLLERLLATIPCRRDLQIIVVDDCTELNGWRERFMNKYPDIELYSTDSNSGPGVARNLGIRYAEGEYILFADADDYFNPCIGLILDEYLPSDYDVVYFNANSVDSSTYLFSSRAADRNAAFSSLKTEDANRFRYRFTTPWGKLIRRGLLIDNNITFDDSRISEDVIFSTKVDTCAESLCSDSRCVYCVTSRENSLSRPVDPVLRLEKFRIDCKRYMFLHDKGLENKVPCTGIGEGLHYLYSTGDKSVLKEGYRLCESMGISQWKVRKEMLIQYTRFHLMDFIAKILPDRFWRIMANVMVIKNL